MDDILAPTDFSPCADTAAGFAMRLAGKVGGEITFLHLIDVDQHKLKKHKEEFYSDVSSEVARSNARLEKYIEDAQETGVRAMKAVHLEQTYKSLVEYIEDNNNFLVVMGSHGATGAKDVLMGSSAQKVVRHSPVPVIVVKEDYQPDNQGGDNIVLLSDFSEMPALGHRKLLSIARRWQMEVHLLYINTPRHFRKSREIYNGMTDYCKGSKDVVKSMNIVNSWSVEEGIADYCADHPVGLLAVVSHYHRGIGHYLHHSTTEDLIRHATVPLLSVHD